MELRQLLETRHNKKTTSIIAQNAIDDENLFHELVKFVIEGDYVLSQRAAWPFSMVAETNPELLFPYLEDLTSLLFNDKKHPAVKRGILRAYQYIEEFPESVEGIIINRCFELLNANFEPIAIRVFAMQVVFNLSEKYPEIQDELKESILFQFENQSAGFKSRGKRILKKLEQ